MAMALKSQSDRVMRKRKRVNYDVESAQFGQIITDKENESNFLNTDLLPVVHYDDGNVINEPARKKQKTKQKDAPLSLPVLEDQTDTINTDNSNHNKAEKDDDDDDSDSLSTLYVEALDVYERALWRKGKTLTL